MIDINKLREKITIKGLDVVADTDILEILDRLEEAESDALEQDRLNGMGSEREASLRAKLESAEKERDDVAWQLAQSEQGKRKISEECDAMRAESDARKALIDLLRAEIGGLRVKIEQMERQEPVGEIQRANSTGNYINSVVWVPMAVGSKLYALPGAQPAPSVPDEIERDVLRACCGTFHGSRHRITCEKYKGKRDQETSGEDE